MARVVYSFTDEAELKSSVGFDLADGATESALMSAIQTITNCNMTLRNLISETTVPQPGVPAADEATVKVGLRIHVTDNVNGRSGYFTIPGIDLSTVNLENDILALDDVAAGAPLVAAVEANAVSRDGNPITVTRMERVGRNR